MPRSWAKGTVRASTSMRREAMSGGIGGPAWACPPLPPPHRFSGDQGCPLPPPGSNSCTVFREWGGGADALAEVEELHDVRVMEMGDGVGLVTEARLLAGAGVRPGQNHLQRPRAVQTHLPRPVHHAHAAASQLLFHLVSRHDG